MHKALYEAETGVGDGTWPCTHHPEVSGLLAVFLHYDILFTQQHHQLTQLPTCEPCEGTEECKLLTAQCSCLQGGAVRWFLFLSL